MPRGARAKKLFPVALSINAMADAMQLRPTDIRELIERADIPVYAFAMRRRVLVQDVIDGMKRVWPRVETKKRGQSHDR